jgi:hypothetical protein
MKRFASIVLLTATTVLGQTPTTHPSDTIDSLHAEILDDNRRITTLEHEIAALTAKIDQLNAEGQQSKGTPTTTDSIIGLTVKEAAKKLHATSTLHSDGGPDGDTYKMETSGWDYVLTVVDGKIVDFDKTRIVLHPRGQTAQPGFGGR